jgi:hypothetical protein
MISCPLSRSVCFAAILAPTILAAQAFNIDIDVPNAPPEQGGGVPSSSFGAAAGQTGFWNGIASGGLIDTAGSPTSATIAWTTNGAGLTTGAFSFFANTGDYALLLNDGAAVGTLVAGGWLRFTISGLTPGTYDLYTYAVSISGATSHGLVYVPQAIKSVSQMVNGPMLGNNFEYLRTHSLHRVVVGSAPVDITVFRSAGEPEVDINGLQVVPVPEAPPLVIFGLGVFLIIIRKVCALGQ